MTKRADKAKNIDKVAAELAKNPLSTQQEIANRIGVAKSTVCEAKKEVEQNQTKDPRILALTDIDYQLTFKSAAEQLRRVEETPDKVNNSDLVAMARESAKRYTIFRGEITDSDGGMKNNAENMNTEDLLKIVED